jgi:hypothetical protein
MCADTGGRRTGLRREDELARADLLAPELALKLARLRPR